MRRMMHEEFAAFVRSQTGDVTIDELARRFIATQAISADFREAALVAEVKVNLRKAINEDRDDDGVPRLQSVLRTDPATGQPRPVYVQSTMFEVDDFKRQWRKADDAERRCREKKQKLQRDFAAAFPDEQPLLQQLLPFVKRPADDGAGGHAA